MGLAVPDPPLSDGVVVLRVPSEQDLPAVERRMVDPDIVRWIGPSAQTARERLELNQTGWTQGTAATFSICDLNDACLGHVWLDVDPADAHRGALGYWLLPEARGKGFATRSVQLVTRWALGELGMARLSLTTEPSNDRSQRVAERSGFVREGVLRSYVENGGRRVDCVAFSLVPADLGRDETSPTTKRAGKNEPVTEPKTQRERREAVNAIKLARGCEDPRCMGYPSVAMVLSFDHLDPSTEDFKISAAVLKLNKQRVSNIRPRWTYPKVTWLEVLDEIEKCDVVCLNCHAIRTAERGRQVIGRPEFGMSKDDEA